MNSLFYLKNTQDNKALMGYLTNGGLACTCGYFRK